VVEFEVGIGAEMLVLRTLVVFARTGAGRVEKLDLRTIEFVKTGTGFGTG